MEQGTDIVNYEYQILRYRHDIMTGEFANLGIVYFDAETKTLMAKFVNQYGRLSKFFGKISHASILRILRGLENRFENIAKLLQTEQQVAYPNIESLTTAVFPKDNNALFFSETYRGWHFNHEVNFHELYHDIIEIYQEKSKRSTNDAHAWSKVYKRYFDAYNITPRLKPKEIKTELTTLKFDKTVQNGALHCFHSVSFDLASEKYIKDKIFRLDGKMRELATAREPMKVYLLSLMSNDDKLNRMIESKLNFSQENVEVEVIHEAEAPQLASRVNALLEEH